MTKSKKMKKSTFAIVIMAILMVAMLAFGGTYAYFTATANGGSETAQMGHVKLTAADTFQAKTGNLVPGDTLFTGNVGFKNDSNVDTFVVARFTLTYTGLVYDADGVAAEGMTGAGIATTDATGKLFTVTGKAIETSVLTGLSIDDTKWTKVADGAYLFAARSGEEGSYTYDYKVAATDTEATAINLFAGESATVSLDKTIARNFADGKYDASEAADGELVWEDAQITITVSFTQIQYANIQGLNYESLTASSIYTAISSYLK